MATTLALSLRELLVGSKNPNGGWAYNAGKKSRLEPTCWALLSLIQEGRSEDRAIVESGLALLAKWQTDSGLVAEPGLPPNLAFNGLASLCLTAAETRGWRSQAASLTAEAIVRAIVDVKSAPYSNLFSAGGAQDNSLIGWPWTESAFSWVEPTSLCMLALKKARSSGGAKGASARIAEGEALLLNRQCADGGWNAGNAEVLGQDLHSYVPTTALVLIAMQDQRDGPAIRRGVDCLLSNWRTEPAGMALALSLLCFSAHGIPAADVMTSIAASYEQTKFLHNVSILAIVHFALTASSNEKHAFAL